MPGWRKHTDNSVAPRFVGDRCGEWHAADLLVSALGLAHPPQRHRRRFEHLLGPRDGLGRSAGQSRRRREHTDAAAERLTARFRMEYGQEGVWLPGLAITRPSGPLRRARGGGVGADARPPRHRVRLLLALLPPRLPAAAPEAPRREDRRAGHPVAVRPRRLRDGRSHERRGASALDRARSALRPQDDAGLVRGGDGRAARGAPARGGVPGPAPRARRGRRSHRRPRRRARVRVATC